jgi:hypothetical protein
MSAPTTSGSNCAMCSMDRTSIARSSLTGVPFRPDTRGNDTGRQTVDGSAELQHAGCHHNRGLRVMYPDLSCQPQAVFTGQTDITERHGWRFPANQFEPFFSSGRFDDGRVTFAFDPRAQQRPHRRLVVGPLRSRRPWSG